MRVLVVAVATDGKDAVTAVQKNDFDAVLMDIHMPVMDGFVAKKEIRKLETKGQKIPIIAMTADAMNGDHERSFASGMNDHVTKPIETVKGVSGNIGAEELYAAATVLDAAIQQGKKDELKGLLNEFDSVLSVVLHSLKPLSATPAGDVDKKTDTDDARSNI